MADHATAFDGYLQQQRIGVAVGARGDNAQPVAGTFSFGPEAIAGAAVKSDVTFRDGSLEGLAVHKANHQHLAAGSVLHHGRNQSA